MKKSLCLILALFEILALNGCANAKPPLEQKIVLSDFSQYANISIGESSYDCIVEYLDGVVSINAQSSAAKGLVITYDGNSISLNYEDMAVSFPNSGIDIVNPAVEIYNVLSALSTEAVTAVPIENGIRADGKIPSGSFTALFYKNYSLSSIELKQSNIYIKFKAPS